MENPVIVACASLLVSLVLVLTRKWHGRFSMDHTEGVQKFHTVPTPRIGGVAIVTALVVGWLLSDQMQRSMLSPLLVASIPAFAFGLLEDVTKRVGVTLRLLATMGSGVVACLLTGVTIHRADIMVLDEALRYWPVAMLFTAFAVGGIANAINIIDGFNGLAAGSVMIMLAALAYIAHGQGDVTLASTCTLLGAAVLGFWLVNFPFGKLFLGDGGAYFVGFALAWLAVSLPMRNPGVSPWFATLAIAYPVIEVLYSVWRRMSLGGSAGAPDSLHLHSLVKSQCISPRLKQWPAPLRNAAVSPIIWIFVALPAVAAAMLVERSKWYALLSVVVCVLLYHAVYRYLAKDAKLVGSHAASREPHELQSIK